MSTIDQGQTSLARLLGHWPVALGFATAAVIALDMESGAELAKILAASAVVYLGAAALGSRGSTWPVFIAAFVLIQVSDVVAPDFEATWAVLGLGLIFAVYGLARGSRDENRLKNVRIQGIAMIGFGLAAVIAFSIDETAGSLVVAAGLLGHAAWDLPHYRKHIVVARSLAEFCLVLDTVVALSIVALVATGN